MAAASPGERARAAPAPPPGELSEPLLPDISWSIRDAVAVVVYAGFEWDEAKAEANDRKHGVTFEEATTALIISARKASTAQRRLYEEG